MAASSGFPAPSRPALTGSVLLFRAGGLDMALPLADVQEVLPLPDLGRGPGQPPFVAGYFVLDGLVALVFRLDRLLDRPEDPDDLYAPLIRLTDGDVPGPVRLLRVEQVDAVHAVARSVPVHPSESFNGCVIARFEHEGRVFHILDRQRLLLVAEDAATRAYAGLTETRLDALDDEATS